MKAFRDEIIKQATDEQLIKDLSGLGKISLFFHFGLVTIVFFLLKNIVSLETLIIWLSTIIIISIAHMVIQYTNIQDRFSKESYIALFLSLALFQALIWSNGIVFILDSIPGQYQVFLIFIAGGLSAIALAILYPSLLMCCAYTISMMVPIIISLLMKWNSFSSMVAVAILFFLAILIFSAVNSNRKCKRYIVLTHSLDKQKSFIRKIYNAAQDISFITCKTRSNEYQIVSFSRGAEAFFEYKSEKAVGKSLKEIHSPESFERWAKLITEVCGNAIPIKGEIEVVKNSGESSVVLFSIYPLFDESNEIYETLIVSTDITGHMQTEKEKLNSLERIKRQQSVLVKLASVDFTAKNNITSIAEIVTELASEALQVERASVWLLSDDRRRLRCIDLFELTDRKHSNNIVLNAEDYPRYFEALKSGRAIDAHDAHTDPRTSEFSKEYLAPLNITSMLDAAIRVSGEIIGVVCHENVRVKRQWSNDEIRFAGEIADQVAKALMIFEQKIAVELLRQSEQKYRSLVESMQDGVGICDLDENIIFINEAACKIFGYSREELKEMNLQEIVYEKDLEKMLNETQKRTKGEPSVYELTFKRKDNQLRQISVSVAPLYDKNKRVEGAIGIFSDITDQKKTEKEKRELREKLVRAQRMESLGVLAGGVAHDLNNILGPLVAYPELIRTEYPEDSLIKGHITKIENSAKRAADIVQDLLTMARRGRYEMMPISLDEVINSYLQSPDFSNLISNQPDVNIKVDLNNAIPKVHGSASHLSKVIMNLVINAVEVMPEGGDLCIQTQSCYIEKLMSGFDNIEAGKYVIMTVSDTGSGIAPEDLKHLFEPFYSKKEMGKSGSGLGLAIVYGVIKDHNGYIDVNSEVNIGTEFVIYLPVVEVASDKNASAVVDIRGSEKILIVDDMEEQRALASTILSSLGYNVQTAADRKEALKLLSQNRYDIVILDMILDKYNDGLDTYREIIKHCPDQKAIITSGFSETDRVIEAKKLGVGKFVEKPYTMQKMGKAIREVLDLKPVEVQQTA